MKKKLVATSIFSLFISLSVCFAQEAVQESVVEVKDKIEKSSTKEEALAPTTPSPGQITNASDSVVVQVNNCIENRSGLDIGSGATKFKIYKFNFCEKKLQELLFEKQYEMSFKENLAKNADQSFSHDILEEFKKAILEILDQNKKFNVQKFRGVATEAFRQSKNGSEFLRKIAEEYKITLDIISQEEEASLGFKSAFHGVEVDSLKSQVMWDIGGGSMQMVVLESGIFHSFLGKVASISFKDQIIEKIKKKNISELNSPNPLSEEEITNSSTMAQEEALKIPELFRQKIKSDSIVVGVGGVFQHSVLKQVNKENDFLISDLEKAIKERVGFKDADFKSNFFTTELTNLILVTQFMKVLGINQVIVRKANLTEALVLD